MCAAKYDVDREKEVIDWMRSINSGKGIVTGGGQGDALMNYLKNGVYLCEVINKLTDQGVPNINESKMAFKQLENIGNFLTACEKYGVERGDLFQTVDLYEAQNPTAVVNCIYALAKKASEKGQRGIVKEGEVKKRSFSKEQLAAGDPRGVQGTHPSNSMAGQNFGKTRSIID